MMEITGVVQLDKIYHELKRGNDLKELELRLKYGNITCKEFERQLEDMKKN